MANLTLAFAELLAGGVLLVAGTSSASGSVRNVITGLEHGLAPLPGAGGTGSTTGTGATGQSSVGSAITGAAAAAGAAYVNPFPGASASRVDQGVDYTITQPVLAPGNMTVKVVQNISGFGTYIAGVLTSGPLAGRAMYVAEGVAPASGVQPGAMISAGQPLAVPAAGPYGTGVIEAGWANPTSGWFAPLAQSTGGYQEGDSTAAGASFNRFIQSLGGPLGRLAATIEGTVQGFGLP